MMPTREAWEQDRNLVVCQFCQSIRMELKEHIAHPGGGLTCLDCDKFVGWLRMEKNEFKRERLPDGTLKMIWDKFGNHCAFCNLTLQELEMIGVGPTIQHVPAYKDVGHNAQLIPFCDWCQREASAKMKRLNTMIEKISRKISMPNVNA